MQLKYHMVTIEDLVPENHFLRKLEELRIDFFVRPQPVHDRTKAEFKREHPPPEGFVPQWQRSILGILGRQKRLRQLSFA